MDYIIGIITTNTITLVLSIIIGIMILLAVIKRLSRLFIAAVIVLACYAGYLYFSGQKVPTTKEEILQHGAEQIDKYNLDKKASGIVDEVISGTENKKNSI